MRTHSFEPRPTVRMPRFVWEEGELEIIGPVDTRRCVVNTRALPFRFICHLFRPHPSPCTGTLIGPRTVLTAGHCLDDGHLQMRIIPGLSGSARTREPFGSARAADVVFAPGFIPATPTDYGVVILREPIGNKVGWWTFDHFRAAGDPRGTSVLASDGALPRPGSRIDVAGYPCDLPAPRHLGGRRDPCFRRGVAQGTVLYHDRNRLSRVRGGLIEYFNDTAGCMSGSPVWVESPTHGRMLIAVHTTGSKTVNSGVLIAGSVRDFVRAHSFSPPGTNPPGRPTVRYGSHGVNVRELQYRLNVWILTAPGSGQARLKVDGIFGRKTLAATRAFQRAMRLAVDGIVGPQTWRRLQLPF